MLKIKVNKKGATPHFDAQDIEYMSQELSREQIEREVAYAERVKFEKWREYIEMLRSAIDAQGAKEHKKGTKK